MIHGRRLCAAALIWVAGIPGVAQGTVERTAVEYLVRLHSATPLTRGLSARLGIPVKRVVSAAQHLVLVQKPSVQTEAGFLASFTRNSEIEYFEKNFSVRVSGHFATPPEDPGLTNQWGLVNTGQTITGDSGTSTGRAGIDLGMAQAWPLQTGSQAVTVAILDSGVNYREPDLAANIFNNQAELNGQAGVDDDANGWVDDFHGIDIIHHNGDPMDVFGHGTFVAGTIGSQRGDVYGIAGINQYVTLLPIRCLGDDGSGNLADAVTGIDYAIRMRAQILNISWGGGPYSRSLSDALTRAREAGILVVAAAGNDAQDSDQRPSYPSSYASDNIVSVAAVDPRGELAGFSNFGRTTVDLGAPGVNIEGHSIGGLVSWSGTSVAAPFVSGTAALLLAQNPAQSYLQLKTRLLSSARPLAGLRQTTKSGGLVNAYYALTNTAAPPDSEDPIHWQKATQTASTPHPYPNNYTQQWTFKISGAKQVAVYFDKLATETNYDQVTFIDANGNKIGTRSGNLSGTYGPTVNGESVTVLFSSDAANVNYGFDITSVAYR